MLTKIVLLSWPLLVECRQRLALHNTPDQALSIANLKLLKNIDLIGIIGFRKEETI